MDLIIDTVDDLLRTEARSISIDEWLKQKNPKKISEAIEDLRSIKTLEERGYYDKLKSRYPQLRRYFSRFCNLPFQAEVGGKVMLEGIKIFKKMDTDPTLSGLNEVISNRFISEKLRKTLKNEDGEIPRSYCEMLFALEMKEAIRAGQVHLPQSRKNVSFWSMIYDPKVWKQDRDRLYVEVSLSPSPYEFLDSLTRQYDEVISDFISKLSENPYVDLVDGSFKLGKVESNQEEVESAKVFLESSLPKIRIEDLLLGVNKKCGFLKEFKPLPGYDARVSDKHEKILLAALVAHGTNLGIAAMGNSTKGITQEDLSSVSHYFIRESTIKAANAVIVDYYQSLPLSQTWGDGNTSSSDGQRFGVQKSSLLASFYPRYFGYYDRAVTVYTHTSDQYSVFHTNVISCGVREAVYLLDGLLENNTDLRPTSHFTDSHGYTEHLFALCHLLGFSFMPRIKDLSDQKIYKVHREKDYGNEMENLFSGWIDLGLIQEQWDLIVRIVASLRDKTSPAHLIVGKLARSMPGDRLAKAITQLGRLVKTIFIFRYLSDDSLRKQIQKQLNRGEARHHLAKWLLFAN
jgi:TnpA family transposase